MAIRGTLGSFLFGVFIIGAYIYGTIEMNRSGARAAQFRELRGRVINYVDQQPADQLVTLAQLRQAQVLSEDDLALLEREKASYTPISSNSPGHAVVFTQRQRDAETRYTRDGGSQYLRRWHAPDGAYALTGKPTEGKPQERTLVLLDRNEKLLASFDLQAAAESHAHWSDDGRYVAVTTHLQAGTPLVHYMDCGLLLEIGPNGVRSLALPAEVRPENLLPAQHGGKDITWWNQWVMAKGWRGHVLLIETHGQGRIGQDPGSISFNLIYRSELVVGDGQVTLGTQRRDHYVETPR